jgi:3-hydroxybutyryl-CoA dehydrogenase
MNFDLRGATTLVVGAGIMGAGIAQVAAQSGHAVKLFDTRAGAAADAKAKLKSALDGLVNKGKLDAGAAEAALERITPIATLEEARDATLVIEAIVENLEAKRGLFKQLEALLGITAVLATNTSSISVTAIANGLARPDRLVGMHFFNPVPLMKLVEVVSGLQTDAAVAAAIFELAKAWGKVPVHAKSTPGFIVNRIARPYYAETLALLLERAAEPQVIDACLKAAGFRMGPCELMDLVGHDTNFAVTQSVYQANFYDKRYVPSPVQAEMVAGGLLGRKSGRGFYRYEGGATVAAALPAVEHPALSPATEVVVHGSGPVAEALHKAAAEALAAQGRQPGGQPGRERDSVWTGLRVDAARLVLTDGRTAQEMAAAMQTPNLAVFDQPLTTPWLPGTVLAYATAPGASAPWRQQAGAWLAALGLAPVALADAPGLVVARTVAMLINEAADAVLQGVCSAEGADAAMKLGVNYPAGPFDWLARWSVAGVIDVLRALDAQYRGERYRVSPWLRRRA